MKEKISIIVPIYNTQKYLKKCIDSIIKQTYSNLEIILINDGSTDECEKICEQYLKKDSRIVFINKKNTGVSDTRNEGLKVATGEYIGFVDSDDYLEENMFEVLYENMIRYNVDISMCECIDRAKDEQIIFKNSNETIKFILEKNGPQGFLWNKLYKMSIIKDNDIKLDKSIFLCEDLLFNCQYLDKIQKSVYTTQKLYNYINREESACNEEFNYKWESLLDAYDKMKLIYETKNKEIYDYFKAEYVLTNINVKTKMYLAKKRKTEIEQRCNKIINCYLKEILKSENISLKKKFKIFCYHYFHSLINLLKKVKMKIKQKGM